MTLPDESGTQHVTIPGPAGQPLNLLKAGGPARAEMPPILLVHGAWHGAWCWRGKMMPWLVQQGHQVSAMDLRGHGNSPAVSSMRFNRIAGYADDVAAAIAAHERPPVVIGHSMGGFVCQHLLARGTSLAGCVLMATVPSYGVWKVTARIALHRPVDFLKTNLLMSLWPLVEDPRKAATMFLDAGADGEELRAFHEQLCDESWLAFIDMLLLALPGKPAKQVPTLVIGGEKDTLFDPQSQRHTAARLSAPCHIIKDAPHNLMLAGSWQQTAHTLTTWLEEQFANTARQTAPG